MKQPTNIAKQNILVGLDLGQQHDYTVLSVFKIAGPDRYSQNSKNHYTLTNLYRAPLKISYTEIVDGIALFIHNYLAIHNYTCIVDYTGVGRPIVDMLREQKINVVAVNTTGGVFCNWKSTVEVSVPKRDIVTSLKATLEGRRLSIVNSIDIVDVLVQEFVNFTERKNEFANLQFEAKYGYHDDIVMSAGLAIWYGENRNIRKRKIDIMVWE